MKRIEFIEGVMGDGTRIAIGYRTVSPSPPTSTSTSPTKKKRADIQANRFVEAISSQEGASYLRDREAKD